jgi:AcrR family transcriptional regulator
MWATERAAVNSRGEAHAAVRACGEAHVEAVTLEDSDISTSGSTGRALHPTDQRQRKLARPPALAEPDDALHRSDRHEAVLDQASRRFNAVGISLDTLAETAGEMGLTRAALYGYVADREDLVFQCYRRSCEIMRERLSLAHGHGSDAFGVIAAFISNVLDPDRPEAAALSELGCLTPVHQAIVIGERDALVSELAAVLTHGQRSGALRSLDVTVAAHAILSLVFWMKLGPRWLAEEATLPRERLEAASQTLLFEGLATQRVDVPIEFVDLSRLNPHVGDAFDRKAIAAAKVKRMLATASRLFNLRGVETTSVEDIASEIGVTKRTIYNHFPDKQALISACQLRGYQIFTDIVEQAKTWPGSRAEALGAALYASVLCSFKPELTPLRVFSGLNNLPLEKRALAAEATGRLQRAYRELFEEGIAEGSLRPHELRPMQLAMAGASSWVAMSDAVDPERVGREMAELVLQGLQRERR